MIDLPSCTSPLITLINSVISCGVNTAVGSSKIKISAPRYKTFKISIRCCCETVVWDILALKLTANPYCFDNSIIFSFSFLKSIKQPLVISLPKMIFSKTEKLSASIKCWCTIPIFKRLAVLGSLIITFFSLT